MNRYEIFYRERYNNPERFRASKNDLSGFVKQFVKQRSLSEVRPPSAISRISAIQRGANNDKELYDCFKGTLLISEL